MGRNFIFLNAVQFLDALNENLFKYIVIYFLIFHQGNESSSVIMSISGAVFILPFLLFSSLGGVFADRWSKTKVIKVTRLIQLGVMIISFGLMMIFQNELIYVLLFISASLAAVFGPSKYGVISELVPKESLVKANGYIAGFTYFGIILGTALASLLDTLTNEHFPSMMSACVLIAFLGVVLSCFMSDTKAIDPKKEWPPFIYTEIADSLIDMYKTPYMLTSTFCYSYFIFIGAFVQMNIIPYSISTLDVKPVIGGYFFLFTSVGVGIGSLIASKTSGKLSSLPWYNLGMSIGCLFFTLFPLPLWLNVIWLIGIGIFGGLFLVPPQAYIATNSRPETRGRNFGAANFFSFFFALVAAAVLYIFSTMIGLSPSMSFAWVGIGNLGVTGLLFFLTRQKRAVN